MDLPNKKYQVIYADPPWTYRDKANSGQRGAGHKYPCMELADLMQLPIKSLAAENCVLFMWHVPVMPLEALKVMEAWGFRLVTMKGFTWAKLNKHFQQVLKKQIGKKNADELADLDDEHLLELLHKISFMGMGTKTRANTEDCLIAVRGKFDRIDGGVRQLVFAPRGRHSAKPDEVRDRIVRLAGDVPRLELFARETAPGWDSWGNEL